MTLLDIRNQIVGILCDKDTFSLPDFDGIKVASEHMDEKDGLIRETLAELVEIGLLRKVGDLNTWILSTPLNIQGQDVHISMDTANGIASQVNAYLDAQESTGPRVDSLNINEGAIVALLKIIDSLIQ